MRANISIVTKGDNIFYRPLFTLRLYIFKR